MAQSVSELWRILIALSVGWAVLETTTTHLGERIDVQTESIASLERRMRSLELVMAAQVTKPTTLTED